MAENRSTISKFKSTLIGGGARPNLFEVNLTIPNTTGVKIKGYNDETFSILCKAAQLPASNLGMIDVPFRGRIFKVAGDRTFDVWTVTVINDEDFAIRRTMENWAQYVAQYGDGSGTTTPTSYMTNAVVKQLRRSASDLGSARGTGLTASATSNGVIGTYIFDGIFPTNISAIDLSYDSTDTIEEFTVEFQVQYWYPADVSDNAETTPE